MRESWNIILITATLLCLARGAPRPLHGEQKTTPTLYGKVTAGYINQGFRGAHVYIFTMSGSKRLRQIDEEGYSRAHAPGVDEREAEAIEIRTRESLSELVSTLPHTALTKTDSKGNYAVNNLAAGRRYYVIVDLVSEDGLFLAAGITPILQEGQRVRFDLRDDSPWQDRFRPKQ